MYILSPD